MPSIGRSSSYSGRAVTDTALPSDIFVRDVPFEAAQAYRHTIDAKRGCGEPDPAKAAIGGRNLYVQGKAPAMFQRIGPEPLHRGTRRFPIQSLRCGPVDGGASGQTEEIIDTRRPAQTVIAKVAIPYAQPMFGQPVLAQGKIDSCALVPVKMTAKFEPLIPFK